MTPTPTLAVLTMVLLLGSAFVLRRRLMRRTLRAAVAVAFGAIAAATLWDIEWFDVYRHGFPDVAYVLSTIGLYALVFAALGWLAASAVTITPDL